jgi:hypothetical protein
MKQNCTNLDLLIPVRGGRETRYSTMLRQLCNKTLFFVYLSSTLKGLCQEMELLFFEEKKRIILGSEF